MSLSLIPAKGFHGNEETIICSWYLVPNTRFSRSFYYCFAYMYALIFLFSLKQTTMTEGHSEQAVQQHPTMMLLICYGPVGLDLILPCCLYWDCVVFMKLWEINLFWFDLIKGSRTFSRFAHSHDFQSLQLRSTRKSRKVRIYAGIRLFLKRFHSIRIWYF